jgi:pimeloyl-ACP methyl ester carboxylesterase
VTGADGLTLRDRDAPGGAAHRHVVAVDDGELVCLELGAGPAMVMLHGWTLDHRCWAPQHALASGCRLILPDRRGFGRSTALPALEDEWRDVDALLGAEPFVLLGLSQGASVALDYARHRPDRLRGLILVGAPLHGVVPNDGGEPVIRRSVYAEQVRSGNRTAMYSDWLAHPLTRVTPVARSLLDAMLADYDGRDLLGPGGNIRITAADIAGLTMPVLTIAGSGDTPWRRQVAAWIAATAPRGRYARIDGAGHLCNLDRPDAFNAIVSQFLSTLSR